MTQGSKPAAPESNDWSIDWRTLLFTAVFFPLLIGLGFWQLSREQEKTQILSEFEARRNMPPVALNAEAKLPVFTPVRISGEFDAQRYWLLDNRINGGRYGVEVVSLFNLSTGGAVLVNRGWIAADAGLRTAPEIKTPEGMITALAQVRDDSSRGMVPEERDQPGWPKRVQWLQIADAEQILSASLLPVTVVLDEAQPGSLIVRPPAVINMPPAKHRAYAVQWFALAATLLALVIWRARLATQGNNKQ